MSIFVGVCRSWNKKLSDWSVGWYCVKVVIICVSFYFQQLLLVFNDQEPSWNRINMSTTGTRVRMSMHRFGLRHSLLRDQRSLFVVVRSTFIWVFCKSRYNASTWEKHNVSLLRKWKVKDSKVTFILKTTIEKDLVELQLWS